MKLSKSLIIAALVTGSLFAGSAMLQAQTDTNTPPAGAPPAGAPPGGGRGMRGGPSLDQIATSLKLDDATKEKIKPILDAQRQKMTDLRADTSLAPEDRRAKVQAIRDDTATQLKAILTPDQFDQYQKMTQRRRPAPAASTPPPAAAPQQ
jgi:Spy/CpxP family protein refolding chaperone